MQKSCEFDLIEIKFFCWLDQTKILVTYTFGYWSEVLLFPRLFYVRQPHVAGASQRRSLRQCICLISN